MTAPTIPRMSVSRLIRRHSDSGVSTCLQRVTSPSSSEYTRNWLGAARTDDLVVDRADGRLGLWIHGREGVDDLHPGAVAVV